MVELCVASVVAADLLFDQLAKKIMVVMYIKLFKFGAVPVILHVLNVMGKVNYLADRVNLSI
uniref:Uncharacterized protein n=1 Tax=viral metagenome TaxID=1070528 RepID=A0A6C0C952_9ZZZZ